MDIAEKQFYSSLTNVCFSVPPIMVYGLCPTSVSNLIGETNSILSEQYVFWPLYVNSIIKYSPLVCFPTLLPSNFPGFPISER